MTTIEKMISKLIGQKVKEVGTTESGERKFLLVNEGRVMTHSELNYRFSLN
jgi:hypothetical protein